MTGIGLLEFAILVVCIRAVQQVTVAFLKRRRADPDRDLAALAERLARLEDVAHASAIEVERIGEGQRFLTNALTERLRDAAPERHTTPRSMTPPD